MDRQALSRRAFLYGTAAAAGATLVPACSSGKPAGDDRGEQSGDQGSKPTRTQGPGKDAKGSFVEPLPVPDELHESPQLTELVKQGNLPELTERLPERPYVVPQKWLQPGKYGGAWRLAAYDLEGYLISLYMYGNSPLRYLNDGQDWGPGLAESWESNDNATQWTIHFRKGLKWSDGKPWTTADVMYWWEDMVLNDEHPAVAPKALVAGDHALATMSAPDDYTIVVDFKAPAPIFDEELAANPGRPGWGVPKHYLMQFHPKYNPKINSADWYTKHDNMENYATNPDSPTMTAWRLTTYKEGSHSFWERNPYYYAVDRAGNQLPYIDTMYWGMVKKEQLMRLKLRQGKIDFTEGRHSRVGLADVNPIKKADNGLRLWFWDSGSGTGSICFFNYDYPEDAMRKLIREPKFRQALSHAYDRKQVRKNIYFDTGEITTGTLSPKGVTFQVNEQGHAIYEKWRTSYLEYDPEKAEKMLDELGVVDSDGDGYREKPDGSKLTVSLDYPADTDDEHIKKDNLLSRDWNAIGVKTKLNPISPTTWGDKWARGEIMTNSAWEVGDNQPLIYAGWVVPVQTGHWAPLHGQAYIMRWSAPEKFKKQKDVDPWHRQPPWLLPEDGGPIDRLWKSYDKARVEPDRMRRIKLLWDIFKVHIDEGPFFMGVVANYPQVITVKEGLMNVPKKENLYLGGWVNPGFLVTPGIYSPEAWYWDEPDKHGL